jgi:aldehyde:ferredoxin oxidoreductase
VYYVPPPGYGYVAFIDLWREKVRVEELPEDAANLFIGGKGLLYYYGFRLAPRSGDPLDPRFNVFIVAPGFLAGLAPSSSKVGFLARGPATGILCDTYAGQVFAAKLRRAGFSALVIRGRASNPIYIYVEDDRIEFRDAEHLWGSSTWDTWQAVRRETRLGASVATIGPAGENLVRIANIMVDGFRAAGRCGLGAIMGSMNLKAIAVWGSRRPKVYDPEGLRRAYLELYERFRRDEATRAWARYGTNDGITHCARLSMCPTRHWQKPWLPEEVAKRLSGDEVLSREAPRSVYREYAGVIWGWGCPAKCAKLARPRRKGLEHIVVKPEYENLAMLGLAPEVLDVDEVLLTEKLVNDLGLDSISLGEVVSWFMELVEEGLVPASELSGLKRRPRFGDAEAVRELAEMIARRRGVGAVLAEGVERAATILGKGLDRAVHVKGLEQAAWDPRGRRGLGVSYATADVGASHLRGWPSPHEPPLKGPASVTVESMVRDRDWKALQDTMGLCSFIPYEPEDVVRLYKLATGIDRTVEELMMIGWRVEALARIYAALIGRVPEHDAPPRRWMEPLREGPLKGSKAFMDERDFREALKTFYRLRGYHEEYGIPLPETLEKLGLDWAVEEARRALREVELRLKTLG